MPETRNGQSYNSTEQDSYHPSSSHPTNEPTQTPTTIQQQLDQLSQNLGSILHRRGRNGGVGYRAPHQRDDIGDIEVEREVQLGGGQRQAHLAAPIQFRRIYVEVSDFLGKLNPDAFQDWLIALEDYFDWVSVPEDRKVRFFKLKLKGPARA
ncbi:hypothetical protein ACOSQ2_015242 [Xanthoceras sorbifolium]